MVNFPVHQYFKGQLIFEEGTVGDAAYIIKTGSIEISVSGEEGKLVLAALQPGAIFGEMALILKENKRTATAIAAEDSELITIYKNYFMDYLKESPTVIRTLIGGLIERLQETTTRLLKANRLMAEIEEILRLLDNHGVTKIKYHTLIQTVCLCTETEVSVIEKQLEQLEKMGHIQITDNTKGTKVIMMPYKKI